MSNVVMTIIKRLHKIWLILLSIAVFTTIYAFCDDEELITWIGGYYKAPTVRLIYLTDLFRKSAVSVKGVKNDWKMMPRDVFTDLPIFKDDKGEVYILREHDARTITEDAKRLREDVFDILDDKGDNKRGVIPQSVFVDIPLNMSMIGKYVSPDEKKLNYTEIAADKSYKFSLLDRLYFSTITQTTIGFGDVVPASRRVRMLAMLQAFCTLLIVAH